MGTHSSANNARRWIPVDQLLSAIEEARTITLRPRPRPVDPADDWECFRLNPPEECGSSIREASLTGSYYRGPKRGSGSVAGSGA